MTTDETMQRIFTWSRTDGTLILMACDVNASKQAQVFKRVVGSDTRYVPIFTDTGASELFDFEISNNTVYFANGNTAQKWSPENGISNWGFTVQPVPAEPADGIRIFRISEK